VSTVMLAVSVETDRQNVAAISILTFLDLAESARDIMQAEARMNTESQTSYSHLIVDQGWKNYSDDEHESWRLLYQRQMEVLRPRVCPEYLEAIELLGFVADHIPKFDDVNERLRAISGWEVVATRGLVKSKPFFDMLTDRKFPSGFFIRDKNHLDYLEEPDIFHDLFGHIPLLTNPAYADYMHQYGRGGTNALKFKTTKNLARLNWWTIEFGLIQKPDGIKIYGAGLNSSFGEARYCLDDPSAHHIQFDLERCMRTRVYINDFQPVYFVIDSFESLFHITANTDFSPMYKSFKGMDGIHKAEDYLPFDLLPGDKVIREGTQEYIHPKREFLEKSISI
jgi:phenylalanine-4-hydroxylase